MSEYQYYDFLAIDRPLTPAEMKWLRGITSRAVITSTRLTNEYQWGNFKGDSTELLERCFDAHVYVSNFGHCHFTIKFPDGAIRPAEIDPYFNWGDEGSTITKIEGGFLLSFVWENESGNDNEHILNAAEWMAELIGVRTAIVCGDLRACALAWLRSVQCGMVDGDELEPPVPPGLKSLTPELAALVRFLALDEYLIEVAAERSAAMTTPSLDRKKLAAWVSALALKEKETLLAGWLVGSNPGLRAALLRRFAEEGGDKSATAARSAKPRRVNQITTEWQKRLREEKRRQAALEAAEAAQREGEEALHRAAYLKKLGKKPDASWRKIETFIAKRNRQGYAEAAALLRDLSEAVALTHNGRDFSAKLRDLRARHEAKGVFLKMLDAAGFS